MKVVRRILWGLLAVVALLAMAVGVGWSWLQGESGRRWLVAAIESAAESAAASPVSRLDIGGLEGSVPADLVLTDVRLADAQGLWLTIDRARLSLDPWTLFRRRLDIRALEAGRVTLARLPEAAPEPQPPPEDTGVLPDLPVAVDLERLAIGRLELAAPVTGGRPAALSVQGAGRLARGAGSLEARLDVARVDDRPGRVQVQLAFDPDTYRLDLDIAASEPAGGMIADLLDLPGRPPVAIVLAGEGALSDWRGRLSAQAGDVAEVSADASVLAAAGGYVLRLDGGGALSALLPPELAPLLAGRTTLAGEARIEPAGQIEFRPLALTTAAASLSLSGIADWAQGRAALGFEAMAGADSALARLAAGVNWQALHLKGTAEGPLLAPIIQATLTGEAITAPNATAGRLEVTAKATLSDHPEADLAIAVRDLALGQPAAAALLNGAVTGEARIALPSGGTPGDVTVISLTVRAPNATVTGRGSLENGQLAAEGRVEVPALAVLSDPLGTLLDGRAAATWTAKGPLDRLEAAAEVDAEKLTVAGRPLGKTVVEATAANLPDAPQGIVRGRADLAGHGLLVAGGYRLGGAQLNLTDLSLVSGANRITGALDVALDTTTATGKLTGALDELAALSELAGIPLRGHATAALTLDARGGKQAAALTVSAHGVNVAGGDGPLLAADRIEAEASVTDVLGIPTGKVRATLGAGEAMGLTLSQVAVQAEGTLSKASFQARLEGAMKPPASGVVVEDRRTASQPVAVELSGAVIQENAHRRIRLATMIGRVAGEPFRLAEPATVEVTDAGFAVSGLDLRGNRARLALDARVGRSILEGRAALSNVPLEWATLADPTLRLAGRLDAEATLSGSPGDPRGEATIRIDNLKVPQATGAGFSGIDATAEARWRGKRLTVTGQATTEREGIGLSGQADLPLTLDARTFVPRMPAKVPVAARLTGKVQLARFNDLLATSGDRVRGTMDVNLSLEGTLDDPRLGGVISVADGRYENVATGTVIQDITARLNGTGEALTIERFIGKTPDGGVVGAQGRVVLTPWARDQLDVRIRADNARVLQIDLVTANVNADLELDGTMREARLTGAVTVRRAEINIPERMPPSVVELNVIEVGGGKGEAAARPGAPVPGHKPGPGSGSTVARPVAAPADDAGPTLALDLKVVADNQVFLRGRGLEAEMGGELAVTGTAAAPQLVGQLTTRRGQLDLLGKRFDFRRGVLQFDGGQAIDPGLDLVAQAAASGLTAEIQITGRASQPKLELTSNPALPKDEVLARLLFDKPVNRLGAVEAVQLAQSAAQLVGFGAGSGLIDRVRQSIGIDRLEISGGGADTGNTLATPGLPTGISGLGGAGALRGTASNIAEGQDIGQKSGPSVSAGRYLSNDVYVGVEQGLTAGSSRAKVEVDITDNIQAEADVGANADTRFGLKFEWDY